MATNPHHTPQEATLRSMLDAQLTYLATYCTDIVAHGYTDSGYDYFGAALDLAQGLLAEDYDGGGNLPELVNGIGYVGDSAPPEVATWLEALPGVNLP